MITSKKIEGATPFVTLDNLKTGVFKDSPDYLAGLEERNELFESILSSKSFGFTHKNYKQASEQLGYKAWKIKIKTKIKS